MTYAIQGYGAMGKTIEQELNRLNETILGIIDPTKDQCLTSLGKLKEIPDVILDFSHPSSLHTLLKYATTNQVPVVIATTGFNEAQEKEIKSASHITPILYTKNTSLGITVMQKIVRELSKALSDFDIEIIEKHHNQKVDAPSGTAKLLLNEIRETRNVNTLYGREGVSKRQKNDVTVHAVRGGTIMGEHTVLFAGDDEIIEIKHTALSKKLFAKGAVKAATFIIDQKPGLYTMQDAL